MGHRSAVREGVSESPQFIIEMSKQDPCLPSSSSTLVKQISLGPALFLSFPILPYECYHWIKSSPTAKEPMLTKVGWGNEERKTSHTHLFPFLIPHSLWWSWVTAPSSSNTRRRRRSPRRVGWILGNKSHSIKCSWTEFHCKFILNMSPTRAINHLWGNRLFRPHGW